jgi:2-hydroxy-3-oxopropionate reductase
MQLSPEYNRQCEVDMQEPIKKIALIGTGIMGGHMARRLAQAGFEVSVWNRTASKSEKLAQFGVVTADSPSAAVASAEVTIVMLSSGPVVDSVLFEADHAGKIPADSLRKGSLVIVMSSIPVDTSRKQAQRLAALGISYLDAPVSGGEKGASEGALSIMAGGEVAVVNAAKPVFAALGTVTHIGPAGTGQLAKLANQVIVGISVAAVAEALQLARAGDADIAAVRQALLGGFANSLILKQHGERMVSGNFVPGGPAVYQVKDLVTARELSEQYGLDLPMLKAAEGLFSDMVAHGDGNLDHSAVILEIARRGKPA